MELNPLKQLYQNVSKSILVCTVTATTMSSIAREVTDSFLKGEYMSVNAKSRANPSPIKEYSLYLLLKVVSVVVVLAKIPMKRRAIA